MKILKRLLLSIVLVFFLCQGYSLNAMAEEGTDGDFTYYYYEYNGYAEITGYNGNDDEVIIPDEVNGYPVNNVKSTTFTGTNVYKSITVSENVGYIYIDFGVMASEGRIILLGDDTGLTIQNSNSDKKVYVECNYSSIAKYLAYVEYIYRDGHHISEADITVTPSEMTKSEAELGTFPEVEVKLNGKLLTNSEDYYIEYTYPTVTSIGEVSVNVHGMLNEETKVYGSTTFTYIINPDSVGKLCGNITTTHKRVGLRWDKSNGVTGYEIYRKENGKYKLVGRVKGSSKTTFIDNNLKESTGYTYKVRAYKSKAGKKYYSEFSNELTVYTLPKKAKTSGYTLTNKNIKIKGYANSVMAYDGYNSNWSSPSEINDFVDYKGRYTITYSASDYVYIQRYNANLKLIKTIKIKKKYPKLGDVICDKSGNYYIAWGKDDVKGNGNVVTFAISKYNYKGKHIKTATLKSYDGYDGKWIFEAGNCAMAIQGNHLVCSYAKEMYNGHQKNETFAVNIKNMKRVEGYSYWVSHSFNQRVIALKDGGVLFGDHGDAYDRGFILNYNNVKEQKYNSYVPFHFWGLDTDDMFHVNKTYAQLGNIGEVDTGYVLVGTSAKAMTSKAQIQRQQLMIQIINPTTGKSVLKGSSRSGTSFGIKYKDTGIKWLTNYKDGSYATNSNMIVIGNNRILVMWEKHKDYEFKDSYYMILSSTGKILKKATSLKKARLCGNEELNYHKGYVYWTSAETEILYDWNRGQYEVRKTIIHKLKVANMK